MSSQIAAGNEDKTDPLGVAHLPNLFELVRAVEMRVQLARIQAAKSRRVDMLRLEDPSV
jgi:hypothetical protein